MKRWRWWLLLLLVLAAMLLVWRRCACPGRVDTRPWMVAVYGAADWRDASDECALLDQLASLQGLELDARRVRVVALVDGSATSGGECCEQGGRPPCNAGLTQAATTRIFRLEAETWTLDTTTQPWGDEANTGDKATLVRFVTEVADPGHQHRVALVLFGHGRSPTGCCFDQDDGKSGQDVLTPAELVDAMDAIMAARGSRTDLLGVYACNMCAADTLLALGPSCRRLLACSGTIRTRSWALSDFVRALSPPAQEASGEPGLALVDGFDTTGFDHPMSALGNRVAHEHVSIALMAGAFVPSLGAALDDLGTACLPLTTRDSGVEFAIDQAEGYDPYDREVACEDDADPSCMGRRILDWYQRDLGSFARELRRQYASQPPDSLERALASFEAALASATLGLRPPSEVAGRDALFAYFPRADIGHNPDGCTNAWAAYPTSTRGMDGRPWNQFARRICSPPEAGAPRPLHAPTPALDWAWQDRIRALRIRASVPWPPLPPAPPPGPTPWFLPRCAGALTASSAAGERIVVGLVPCWADRSPPSLTTIQGLWLGALPCFKVGAGVVPLPVAWVASRPPADPNEHRALVSVATLRRREGEQTVRWPVALQVSAPLSPYGPPPVLRSVTRRDRLSADPIDLRKGDVLEIRYARASAGAIASLLPDDGPPDASIPMAEGAPTLIHASLEDLGGSAPTECTLLVFDGQGVARQGALATLPAAPAPR